MDRESAAALRGEESATHLGTIVTPWRHHSGKSLPDNAFAPRVRQTLWCLGPKNDVLPQPPIAGITRVMIVASDNRAVNSWDTVRCDRWSRNALPGRCGMSIRSFRPLSMHIGRHHDQTEKGAKVV